MYMYIYRVFPTGKMGRDIKWGLLAQFSTKTTFYSDIFTTYLQLLCPAQSTLAFNQRVLAKYFWCIYNCCVSHIGRLK